MKDSHEESGPQRHNAGGHEDTPKSAAAVTNGEAVLYLVCSSFSILRESVP